MILIFSIDGDYSTDVVIDWLKYYKYPYKRLNAENLYKEELFIDFDNKSSFSLGGKVYDVRAINVVWQRKFGFYQESEEFKSISRQMGIEVANQILRESASLTNAIFGLFEGKKWLSHYKHTVLNKLQVLSLAQSIGLTIPQTHIVSSKERLERLTEKESLITKSVFDLRFIEHENGMFSMYTSGVNSHIATMPNTYFPSLVQKEIRKDFEIRCFYLDGKFYSMALFSQSLSQTELDFRRYAWYKPNRYVPYKLPHDITKKLIILMRNLHLNCGSVDLIKGMDGNYYFLEINTHGQFGMIDFNCNYGLHQKIAELLIKWDLRN